MNFDSILLITFAVFLLITLVAVMLSRWRWLPIVLLPLLWFIPRQTVPNGLLENVIILRWLTVLIIPVIVFVQFIKAAISGQTIKPTSIALPLCVFVVYYFFTGIFNNVSPIDLMGTIILYIRYPLLFIAMVNMDIKKDIADKFIKLYIVLLILQIPECLYRFMVLNKHGDNISWSLGPWGAFDLGVYAIYTTSLVIAYASVYGFRFKFLILLIGLFTLSLIGEIKAFLISVPILSLWVIIMASAQLKSRRIKNVIGFSIVIAVFLVVIFNAWGFVHRGSGNSLFLNVGRVVDLVKNPATLLVKDEKMDVNTSRIFGSTFIWNYIKHDWRMILLGVGPGSLLAGNFSGAPGKLFNLPDYLNQLSVFLGEGGIIGLGLYAWLLITLMLSIKRMHVPRDDYHTIYIRSAWYGMCIYYTFLGPLYDVVWRHDSPNFLFYFIAAYLISQSGRVKQTMTGNRDD
jgi:hypothetical protein